jgi:uncharacterized protein YndB with AHSA1/START domain
VERRTRRIGDRLAAAASGPINADPAAIWAVITDPRQLGQAFFGATVDTDWRVGSPITYRGEWEGRSFEDKGEIVKFEPDKLLQFTHFSPLSGQPDIPENHHMVTFDLAPRGDGTELVITQTNAASQEERNHSEANWARVLNSIKHAAER